MKKLLVLILVFLPTLAFAQRVTARRIKPVAGTENKELYATAISPDGTKILASTPGYKGLTLIDIKNNTNQTVTDDPGAGYEPAFSDDGKQIFYRSDEFVDNRKFSSLIEYNVGTGAKTELQSKARDLKSPVVSGNRVIWASENGRKAATVNPELKSEGIGEPYVMLEDLIPVLYRNSQPVKVTPNGPGNYIWLSLSPDKTKLLYNFMGTCTYVSDTDGNIIASLGSINAPKWINNNTIIGMNDQDDGHRITSSDIVCYQLSNGKTTRLTTTESKMEMYPLPFPNGKQIVFNTVNGGLYTMKLRIRK